MHNSVTFSIFTELWGDHPNQILEQHHYRPRNVWTLYQLSFGLRPHPLRQPPFCCLSWWICLLWTFHTDGIIQHVVFFYDWLLSPNIISLFIYVWCVSVLRSTLYHVLFMHSPVDEPLGCFETFRLLPVMLLEHSCACLWVDIYFLYSSVYT